MNSQPAPLRIGWARRDVTPYGRKTNLAGQFHMRITNAVHDPVTVTALALSAGDDAAASVVFVSCDTSSIPGYLVAECEAKIRGRLESFPVDALVLNATHTHTAPGARDGFYAFDDLPAETRDGLMLPPEYRALLTDRIAEAALESWQTRAAGKVAWGLGHAVVGHNRRIGYLREFAVQEFPGQKIERTARMYGKTNDPDFSHVEGYEDHAVQFLFTFDANDRLTGAVVNVPCPSQVTENWSMVSADYWHDVRELLGERYGRGLFLLPQCSAAGDQSPHLLLHKPAEARMLALKEGVDLRTLDFDAAQRRDIARRIGAAFDDALRWAGKDRRDRVALRHVVKMLNLQRRMVTEDEYRRNLGWIQELANTDTPKKASLVRRCQDVVQKYAAQGAAPSFPIELHVIRLGDIVFVSTPFELFLDYGIRVQARAPAVQTFVVQLVGSRYPDTADPGAVDPSRFPQRGGTYLPTARAEAGGGYSACVYCNQVGHEGGQEWVEGCLREIGALFHDPAC